MRRRGGIGFTVVTVSLFWLASAIAIAVMWPVYQDVRYVIATGGALVLGTALAVLGAVLRLPSYVLLLGGVALFLIAGVPLAVPTKALDGVLPTLEGERELIAGLALGWKQLLTIMLPVGDYQSLLVPPFAAVLTSTIVGLSIALRAKWGEFGAIPPMLLFFLGMLFGPERVDMPIQLALGMLVALLVWMVWRRAYRRRVTILKLLRRAANASGGTVEARAERSVGARNLVVATAILGVACVVSVVATTALPPHEDRTVLRSAVAQPFDPRDYPSPLASLRRYLLDDRTDATMFTVTGLAADARIRIATLDTYDGIVFSVGSDQVDSASGTFVRVPTSIDETALGGSEVTAEFAIGDYTGVWVPTVGALESVRFGGPRSDTLRDDFYYNRTGRTGAVLEGLETGDRYRLRSVLPFGPGEDGLDTVTPGSARVPAIGVLPDEVSTALEGYAQGVQGAGAQLEAVLEGLRRDGYISHGIAVDEPPSRSGHGADRITELFAGTRMIGDAEQYSVAAALMARQLGFPARVVFGFVPQPGDETSADGAVAIRGSDVTAWIEIDTAEFGWMTLDPVPEVRPIPDELPEEPAPIARPQFPAEASPDEAEPRTEQSPPDATQDDQDEPNVLLTILLVIAQVAGWSALGLLVLASPLLIVIAAKARRRRLRQRAPTPIQRIAGAWDQFRDDALDRGFIGPPSATRVEFADSVGLQQSKTLAAVADRAAFSPDDEDMSEANRVWLAMDDLGESLDRGRTRWERFRSRISVRSLGGPGVRRLFGKGVER